MKVTVNGKYNHKKLDANKFEIGPGQAILLLESVTEKSGTKGDYYDVRFQVAAHENKEFVGKEYRQNFSTEGDGGEQSLKLMRAYELITDEDLEMVAEGGEVAPKADISTVYGLPVACTITKKGDFRPKVWNFYGVRDPRVEEWDIVRAYLDDDTDDGTAEVVEKAIEVPDKAPPRTTGKSKVPF